jgi:hypothetical protein
MPGVAAALQTNSSPGFTPETLVSPRQASLLR